MKTEKLFKAMLDEIPVRFKMFSSEKLISGKILSVGLKESILEVKGVRFPHPVNNEDIELDHTKLAEDAMHEFAENQRPPDREAAEILEKNLWELT